MDFLEKKTSFNTSRYFTRSKPSIKKYEEEKYESKLFLDDNVNRKDCYYRKRKNNYKVN